MSLLNRRIVKKGLLPEKVLQFGTGVLLRGLPDYFIEKANRAGLFGGSIVVIKSTDKGGADLFKQQDNVYTIHIKGIQNGEEVEEALVVSAISRVVTAASEWQTVLDVARSPEVEVVISNTTEVGIVFDEQDDLSTFPPRSFPGKLTAVLWERFRTFKGADDKGLVILPTELIDKNGETLRDTILTLAEHNRLGNDFSDWVKTSNYFCNTLVDRIVPGSLDAAGQEQAEALLGYRDELAIMAEPFCLWAIETEHPRVEALLSFAKADSRVVITPDISKFKELKLRLLNGSHTFACGLAIHAGFETVREAMANDAFSTFVARLMHQEIIPTLIEGGGISATDAGTFANQVVDRFRNPYLDHKWESISLNYTSKMKMRNLATLERAAERQQRGGMDYMALGFAGYLVAMAKTTPLQLLADWEADLVPLGGFIPLVKKYVEQLRQRPAQQVLEELNAVKI